MSDSFGLKLGIEGEKEFKSALKDINSTFKVLGSELTLVSSQFDKQDRSVEAVSPRSRVLNSLLTYPLKIHKEPKYNKSSFSEIRKRNSYLFIYFC